jgi:hypothetical protein
VTFKSSFAFYDAQGRPQDRFDPVTTAAINTQTLTEGTLTREREGVTMRIREASNVTVSGLAGAETQQTVDGTHEASVVTDVTNAGAPLHSTSVVGDTTTGLVFAVYPVQQTSAARGGAASAVVNRRYPLAGSVVHASRTEQSNPLTGAAPRVFSSREKVTFNGTNVATVEITINGTTRVCTRNLDTGKLDCGG